MCVAAGAVSSYTKGARSLLADLIRKRREQREAKLRAQILRKVEIIEKLLSMMPRDPSYQMTKEAMQAIRASLEKEGSR